MSSVLEELARARRLVDAARLELVVNPDDVTDELRAEVERTPLVELRESTLIERGRAFVVRPGAFA